MITDKIIIEALKKKIPVPNGLNVTAYCLIESAVNIYEFGGAKINYRSYLYRGKYYCILAVETKFSVN